MLQSKKCILPLCPEIAYAYILHSFYHIVLEFGADLSVDLIVLKNEV